MRTRGEEAQKLKSAVKIHWNCILYTALCGGVGLAHFMTGMDQSDGSLQPRDKELEKEIAREIEMGKPIEIRPLSSLGDRSEGGASIFSKAATTDTSNSGNSGSGKGKGSSSDQAGSAGGEQPSKK